MRYPKAALSPLLKARPGMAEELSEILRAAGSWRIEPCSTTQQHEEQHEEGLADRVAANIRRLFSLH